MGSGEGDGGDAVSPTWDEALAHSQALQAQGVDVTIRLDQRVIRISGAGGCLQDPDDGTPARQVFYQDGKPSEIEHCPVGGEWGDLANGTPAIRTFHPDGSPKDVHHYRNGQVDDPAEGVAAYRSFYPDGTTKAIDHYRNGRLHDPADGTPALRRFHPDGSLQRAANFTDGQLIRDPSFPPPIGET